MNGHDDTPTPGSPLLEALARQVPGVLYQFQRFPDGRSCFPFASAGLREVYEVEPAEVLVDATPVFGRLHPDDLATVAASIEQSANTLEPWRCTYRVCLPVRGVRWLYGNARPERLADGSILWHGHITDITENELARQRVDNTMRRLETAIASSLSAIAMADLSGQLTYVNQAFLQLWGYASPDQVVGREAVQQWHDVAAAEHVLAQVLTTGVASGELVAVRTDGTLRTVALQANMFRDHAGEPLGILASMVDVTEERSLQAKLLQAQRMESIGRLAGGVAHDFNNLLTVMKGFVELSRDMIATDDPLAENLAQIDRAVESAASLTQQLLAFSRKQIIAPRVLDLDTVVRRTSGMLQRLLGEHITLDYMCAPDRGFVRFDPAQAEQVLVNLIINARDAMPDGGHLTIELHNATLDGAYVAQRSNAQPGEYVVLTVSDTGRGMSRETREHVFEPFYTTKPVGRGTGLGLAMIHGAVTQNGGRVEVYSELGMGTSFKIYLPRVDATRSDDVPSVPEGKPRGHEHVLVVEDDERVRLLAERLLRSFGYTVTTATNGEEALQWLAQHTAPLHLLLTDVVMPRMNGRALAEHVQALRPETRVLFMSGYTANVIVQHGVLKPGVEFLPKPFTTAMLAQRVRAVLDGAPVA